MLLCSLLLQFVTSKVDRNQSSSIEEQDIHDIQYSGNYLLVNCLDFSMEKTISYYYYIILSYRITLLTKVMATDI